MPRHLAFGLLSLLAGAACNRALSQPDSRALVEPADLATRVQGPEAQRPLILFVGFPNLYQEAHIPGAVDLGSGATPEGLEALEKALKASPPGREIILYCGCCPSDHCPNIRPALAQARKLGFTQVKVLDIPKSFRTDWVKHGFPVAKGD